MTVSPSKEDCPFCAIAQQRAPAREVLRTEDVVSFLPDVPAVLGHTLLAPRRHVRDIWGVDAHLGHALADATRQVAAAVAEAAKTHELNIIQSSGLSAGQSVFHLHIHVVPRHPSDRMPNFWPPDTDWSSGTLDEVATALRSTLSRLEES